MLFEAIPYINNLPFSVSFTNVAQENKHCHEGIEIALVLRGVVNYQIYHTDYELNAGDLIIADVADLHQIHNSSDDALLLLVHVDTKQFEKLYPNISYMFFVCEECMFGSASNNQVLQSKLAILKNCVARLALSSSSGRKSKAFLTDGINELVSILVNHFQGFYMEDYQYKTSHQNISSVDLQRLSSITGYIMKNYNSKITLEDVSKREHLSSYYVSHLIKKTLGFSFQNFVNAIRLEFAEKQLVFSNSSLMQISEDCGFSSPNYFNKCFSAWYGKTPSQYKKEYRPFERSYNQPFELSDAHELLVPYLNLSGNQEEDGGPHQITIMADFDTSVGIDFNEAYRPKVQFSSLSELLELADLEEEVMGLRPSGFIIDDELFENAASKRDASAMMTALKKYGVPITPAPSKDYLPDGSGFAPSGASAIHHIFMGKDTAIPLLGNGKALFTPEGLATPYYFAYDFFSKFKEPLIELGKQHLLLKDEGVLAIVLFNINPHSILNAHIALDRLPGEFLLARTEIGEADNCYSALTELESPEILPTFIKDRIWNRCRGKTQFSVVRREQTPKLNLIVYQNTVAVLEFAEMTGV